MFSYNDLLFSFGIAIGLIFLFKLQRELSPKSYFSMSDIISGAESPPTRMDAVTRILIIFFAGLICNFFVDNPNIIVLGLTMGSFLIVWPLFLNEENIHPSVLEKKLVVYTLLALFVITTYLISKLSIFAYTLGTDVYKIYIQEYSYERMLTSVIDNLLWMILTLVVGALIKVIRQNLDKAINPQVNANYYEEEPYNKNHYEDSQYKEVTASLVDEIEENDEKK